jgi:putative transcription factor
MGGNMEECELCGRQTSDVYVVDVEGVELRACQRCAKGKKIIRTELESVKKPKQGRPGGMIQRPKRDEDKELVDNYGEVIRNAREKMKLPIKVLAEMINEKEHLLARVEKEETHPTIELTKKLERALGIKLTASDTGESEQKTSGGKAEEATLGEFISKEG